MTTLAALGCTERSSAAKPKVFVRESPIIALVGSRRIRRNDLWPSLVEIGGNTAMYDLVLDVAIETTLQDQEIVISAQDIKNERTLLESTVPQVQQQVFDDILETRGFGLHRRSKLLFRNAALRKLISSDVRVTDDATRKMYSIIHGTTYPASVIVVPTLRQATEVKNKLEAGVSFREMAIDCSIDSSASRGGTVGPISVADPVWPAAIRDELPNMSRGAISDPLLIHERWVILTVTGAATKSDVAFEDVESAMYELATLSQERFLMEQLATSLIEQYTPTLFDDDLKRVLRPLTDDPK